MTYLKLTKFFRHRSMFSKTANYLMSVGHFSFIFTEMKLNPRYYKNVCLFDFLKFIECVPLLVPPFLPKQQRLRVSSQGKLAWRQGKSIVRIIQLCDASEAYKCVLNTKKYIITAMEGDLTTEWPETSLNAYALSEFLRCFNWLPKFYLFHPHVLCREGCPFVFTAI